MANKNSSKSRCNWVNLENPLYVAYHDKEWGKPVHNDRTHFQFLILEGAQAGLSWETILKKRIHYRKVFDNFDPRKIAKYTKSKTDKLMQDSGIVRNRLKIESAVSNAKAFLALQREFGSFDKYIWQFVDNKPIQNTGKILSKTPLSDKISKDLKKRGFRFVGSTIIYAYMQAVGLVNDHAAGCFVRQRENIPWYVYLIKTKDNTLYTGITTNVQKRLLEHESSKKGAKYLRGKGPLALVYTEKVGSKSKALKRELIIKKMTKAQKMQMIDKI